MMWQKILTNEASGVKLDLNRRLTTVWENYILMAFKNAFSFCQFFADERLSLSWLYTKIIIYYLFTL